MQEKLQHGVMEAKIEARFTEMQRDNERAIMAVGFEESQVVSKFYLNLRYVGTNTSIMIELPESTNSAGSNPQTDASNIEQLFATAFER